MKLKLKELRIKYDMTQREMAEKLNISKSYYNYFETGERIIPVTRLNDYCNTFKLTFDYVLGLDKDLEVPEKDYEIDIRLIGKRLKYVSKIRDYSQNDIAALLNTSQSTISSYEHGKTMLLTAFLYDFCTKLDVSADYIVGRSEIMKKEKLEK